MLMLPAPLDINHSNQSCLHAVLCSEPRLEWVKQLVEWHVGLELEGNDKFKDFTEEGEVWDVVVVAEIAWI